MGISIPHPAAEKPRFSRSEFEAAPRSLLARGRWPKSEVWRVRIGGEDWTIKDFRSLGPLTRNIIGAMFIAREARALRRLDGLRGVPSGGFAIDRYALAYRFIPGRPLGTLAEREQPVEFFHMLEKTVRAIHARGVIHLDIRNRRNILFTEHGEPLVIDFESHLDSGGWLARLRPGLERFDLGGVYKHWVAAKPGTLGAERQELYERMNRVRKLWVFHSTWFYERKAKQLWSRLCASLRRARS